MPKSLLDKVHFSSIRISLAADNLHTWTKFSGIDPEVGPGDPQDKNALPGGYIGTKYPFSKKFQLGLQLVF